MLIILIRSFFFLFSIIIIIFFNIRDIELVGSRGVVIEKKKKRFWLIGDGVVGYENGGYEFLVRRGGRDNKND